MHSKIKTFEPIMTLTFLSKPERDKLPLLDTTLGEVDLGRWPCCDGQEVAGQFHKRTYPRQGMRL